ncbi:MAG TPA: GGDEF and EAL domain-containing protein [Steroidobacteraceae bacterium]|nr:GGDEF and EAL domain-containing protein [Steroidobacteraceae bacterium]
MSRPASLSSTPAPAPQRPVPSATAVDEVLRRAQSNLDAAFVALHAQEGRISRSVTRPVPGARLLEDIWRHGARALLEQVRVAKGPIGTNRLRGQNDGPVCGRLVAAPVQDSSGALIGVMIAARTVEQDKVGPRETQRISDFAIEIADLLAPPDTGLLSWAAFQERARSHESVAGTAPGCILYGNVDQLHVLNKLAGLTAGDQAIAAVGAALQDEILPQSAGVCHISGDRFAVYLPKTSLSQGRRIAEQLCRSITERCANIGGLRTRLSISFGVASVPANDTELTQAVAAAEAACRAAKDRGRGRVEVYQDADLSIIQRNDDVVIASRLRKALETERIGIVAQPLVPLNGKPAGPCYELLVRMLSDSGSFVSPASFMSAATRYQMLIDLDRVMLMRVFERLKAAEAIVRERGLRFSINLSGPSIGNPDFLEWLSSNISASSVPGEWLQFEITETAAVANVAQTQTLIRHLRARGAQFALDDFGTGVSSFAYLKAFDVSMMKLDGSFTRDLLTDPRSEALVRGIAQLCHSMGIETVAECVETEVVRQRLGELGIDRAQGFLFGQPMPLGSVFEPMSEEPHASSSLVPVIVPEVPEGESPAAAEPLAEELPGSAARDAAPAQAEERAETVRQESPATSESPAKGESAAKGEQSASVAEDSGSIEPAAAVAVAAGP